MVPILLGAFILGFSSIVTGLNFIVTIHTMRGPGLTWNKLPLFVWSIYATSIIQVLATPVLGITLLLTAVEHAFGFGIFDPAHGGDPVLFQHLFWFYSHPAVYIMVLPAMAVMSEIVPTFARKNIFGYKAIAYSSVGIALVGFFAWGHHLFVSGQSTFDAGVFGVLSMLVGVFTAIKVFNWVGTLYKGRIRFTTPFAYFCGFIYLFVFGGMTGVALATVSLDVHWHDTYFVVAHFHFIMVGATLMAFLGALHYWFPKMFGRIYSEGWGLVSASLIILGFNATFIPQFLLGNAGHAAPLLVVPGRVPGAERGVDGGRDALGLRLRHHPRLHRNRAVLRREGRPQPVGLARLRVELAVAAAEEQLRLARSCSTTRRTITTRKGTNRRCRPKCTAAGNSTATTRATTMAEHAAHDVGHGHERAPPAPAAPLPGSCARSSMRRDSACGCFWRRKSCSSAACSAPTPITARSFPRRGRSARSI